MQEASAHLRSEGGQPIYQLNFLSSQISPPWETTNTCYLRQLSCCFFFGSRVGLGRKRVCYTAVANWYINGLWVKHQQTTNRKLIFLEKITVFYSKSKLKWGFILCTRLDLLAVTQITENFSYTSAVPNLCGAKDQFHGRQFFHGWAGNGFGWFKHVAFTVHFISIIITSAPCQIINIRSML